MVMKPQDSVLWKNRWLLLIIILALFLRLIDIRQPYIGLSSWNEAHYSLAPLNYFKYGRLMPMNDYGLDLSTTPLLYWAIYASYWLFGVSEWAARLPSLISGLISLFLIFRLAERTCDRDTAYLGTVIAATMPGIVYFSRSVQLESMTTMFALAAALALFNYADSDSDKWFWASAAFLSLAIFVKYTSIVIVPALLWIWFYYVKQSKLKANHVKLAAYVVLPLLPSLLWIYYGATVTPVFMKSYFFRPTDYVSLASISHSLSRAFFEFLPINLGRLQFYLLISGIPILAANIKKQGFFLLLGTTWLALVIKYPQTYINNWYYDYTALYAFAVLSGYILSVVLRSLTQGVSERNKKTALSLLLIVILLVNAQGYYTPFHTYFTDARADFQAAGEPEPFYSARLIAEQNTGHKPVMVAWPSTMYYAGADPAYVSAFHFQDDKIESGIAEGRYEYVALYYPLTKELAELLDGSGYEKIAPRAWRKKS
ncbi:hypothetical protein BMS3Abin16_00138 [archaeon BMS3Abin16]|nr:hypothetical protein BMS3Abin16_00138 [archaeon BMS3Abin16]